MNVPGPIAMRWRISLETNRAGSTTAIKPFERRALRSVCLI